MKDYVYGKEMKEEIKDQDENEERWGYAEKDRKNKRKGRKTSQKT